MLKPFVKSYQERINNTMENVNFTIMFILGFSILGGLMGASFFQKLRIPQVLGYIVIGLIIGESGLRIINRSDVIALQPLTFFALGIIGFLVGGGLKGENFKKYGRQFSAILLGEGLGAFFLVGILVALIMFKLSHNISIAVATGVVFGAIASATDPASTIDVLWEYRALGILTTSLTAIVALDDALAMTLYGLGTSAAQILTGGSGSILEAIEKVALTLLGAVGLGAISALALKFILQKVHQPERSLAFAVGLLLLLISMAISLDIDVILTTMTLGCVLTNIVPRQSEKLFNHMRNFSTPIYVLFFVLAGARMGISRMPIWLWVIVILYVIGRSTGKMTGAYLGASITHSAPVVRRYLGLGLFAQGGVAIGLSIMASHHLGKIMVTENLALGDAIISGVAATTLIVQLIGPPTVKLAIKLSGEIGRNITKEDVINSWKVADVMDTDIVTIPENEPLSRAAQTFVNQDYLVYPVVNRHNKIVGILSLQNLKDILDDRDSWNWLVASDVMTPVQYRVVPSSPLKEVLEQCNQLHIDQIPVVKESDGDAPVGILDVAKVEQLVDKETLRRQQP
ncbi:hypothetical protein DRQ11_01055 [candidate division KSB1 bacterium]|nr:MAG: hypothetical protein DRQ11_01055 [candidate division KSB1 bacterium]